MYTKCALCDRQISDQEPTVKLTAEQMAACSNLPQPVNSMEVRVCVEPCYKKVQDLFSAQRPVEELSVNDSNSSNGFGMESTDTDRSTQTENTPNTATASGSEKADTMQNASKHDKYVKSIAIAVPAVILGTATVVAAPIAVAAAGFGAGGIAAGSLAASMMSAAATSGGGMAVVSLLQSIGAAGFGATGLAALSAAGSATGAGLGAAFYRLTSRSQRQADTGDTDTDAERSSTAQESATPENDESGAVGKSNPVNRSTP